MSTTGGYICPLCCLWVTYGLVHSCPRAAQLPSSPLLWTQPSSPRAGFTFLPFVCDHCFCQTGTTWYGTPVKDHKQCCNCGVVRKLAAPAPKVEVEP